jgi:Icc-related predicted phosphoesterase
MPGANRWGFSGIAGISIDLKDDRQAWATPSHEPSCQLMRLWIFSDLHLEFGYAPLLPAEAPPCDVVVLAGDIAGGSAHSIDWIARHPLLTDKDVVYLQGNHEAYGRVLQDDIAEGVEACRIVNATCRRPIYFLQRGCAVIHGVRILGCTLWTDYRLHGTPKTSMVRAGQEMNDHRLIRYCETNDHIARFMPWHAAREHRLDLAFLVAELAKPHDGPTVVVTHHLPSAASIARKFQNSSLNPAFASDLDWLIEKHQPVLWVHGHTHEACDYATGKTRVVCNPQGYLQPGLAWSPGASMSNGFQPELLVEVAI